MMGRAAFKAVFDENWAEIPAEHLPALEKGRDLRREWWNGSSNPIVYSKEQLKLMESYDEFKRFVISKMMEN
jgi:hypothetical protein